MSNRKVLLTESSLEDIADAIREKTGSSDTYTPAAMAAGIRSIEGGVTPSDSLAGNLAVAYRDLAYPVAAGTHCVYGGNYYIAAVEIEYAETFNADHWTRVTAGEEIEDLAAAVGDLDTALDGKQPIEPGMGLSTNDYTDADKTALEAMAAALSGAQVRRRYAGAFISAGDTVAEEIAMFTLYGKCIQDGTPTPDAPVAIGIAGSDESLGIVNAGKNLFKTVGPGSKTTNGVTFTRNDDGSVHAVGTNTGTIASGTSVFASTVNLPPGNYCFTAGLSNGTNSVLDAFIWDTTTNARAKKWDGVTASEGAIRNLLYEVQIQRGHSYVIDLRVANGATVDMTFYPMICAPTESDPTFEPCRLNTVSLPTPGGLPGIPVADGGNYTDSAGQRWICDTIDRGSGQYVRRCGIIDSYDGETLPGPWLSSKDVYAEGSSPTVGAKVVYALEWPVATDLTAAQLAALDALRAHYGTTVLFTNDAVQPEMAAAMFVQLPEYTA